MWRKTIKLWICIKGTRRFVKVYFSLAKVFGKMGSLRCECELWRPYDLSCRVIGHWSPRFRLQLPNQPFLLVTLKQPKLYCTYTVGAQYNAEGIHTIYYNMKGMFRHSKVSQDLLYVGGGWKATLFEGYETFVLIFINLFQLKYIFFAKNEYDSICRLHGYSKLLGFNC